MTEDTKPAAPAPTEDIPTVNPAELHNRFLAAIADEYNNATPEHRKKMEQNLALAKMRSVASVGGLRSLFPSLGRLKVKAGSND